MKAALYIRVSTEEQAREGYSIEAQKEICIRWLTDKKYDVVDIYVDDGYSSKNMKRPALQRLMADAPNRKYNLVVFWRLNRLTRSVKDKEYLFDLFAKHNIGIKSMSEELDTTTASGRMVTNLLVSVAQGEREQTAENVWSTMYEQALKGKRNGAVAPYGYDLVDGRLIVNAIEAEVVKRIYSLYQKNHGVRYIAKLFNAEGIPKGHGSKWADHTVYYILTNPTYCGKLRWNYRKLSGARTGKEIIVDGDHEPIVSEEEFNRIQNMRGLRKKIGLRATSDFSFTGVAKCARCGYGMIGSSMARKNDRYRYYKCIGRHNYGICDMPIIAELSIHDAFIEVFNPDTTNTEQYYVEPEIAVTSEEVDIRKKLLEELDNIQKRKKKWQIAYANDVISLEDLKQHTDEDKKREEFIKSQLEGLTEQKKSYMDPKEVIQQLKQLRDIWYQIDDEVAKKNFINEVFSHITINTDVTEAKGGPGRRVLCYVTDWDFNA